MITKKMTFLKVDQQSHFQKVLVQKINFEFEFDFNKEKIKIQKREIFLVKI